MTTYYLSFADDGKSRGACIVVAPDSTAALLATHELGINPGGEVLCFAAETEDEIEALSAFPVGELISPEELRAAGLKSIREYDEETP